MRKRRASAVLQDFKQTNNGLINEMPRCGYCGNEYPSEVLQQHIANEIEKEKLRRFRIESEIRETERRGDELRRERERWVDERLRNQELAGYEAIEKEKLARQDQLIELEAQRVLALKNLLIRQDLEDQGLKRQGKLHYVRGETMLKLGKFSEAIGEADQAIKSDSNEPNYYELRAAALHGMDKRVEAVAELDVAIYLAPGDSRLHKLKADELEGLGLLDECLAEIDEMIRLEPRSGTNRSYKAMVLQKLGNQDGARAEIDNAIRLEPGNFKHLDAAIRLNPNSPVYHIKKAAALLRSSHEMQDQSSSAEAIREYDEAIRLDPNNPILHEEKAASLGELRRDDEAVAEYDEAIRLSPKVPAFHYRKGNALYRLKKSVDAITEYGIASNLDPHNLEYWTAKINALKRSGRFPEALKDTEDRLARAQGRSSQYLVAYAEVMACMDMTTAALNKLSSAVAPGGGIVWDDLAEVATWELNSGVLSEKEKAVLKTFLESRPVSSQTTSTKASAGIQRPRGITVLVGIQIAGSLFASAVAEGVAADLSASVYLIIVPFMVLPSIFALTLFSGRNWARTLMLIGAVLDFGSFFGIVWGVAFLWYLTRPRVSAYFKQSRS